MGRERYKTGEEDVAAEFDRVCQLFQLALGKPSDRVLFDSLMSEANEQGLNWVEGLEYVIEKRSSVQETIDDGSFGKIEVTSVPLTPITSNGLQKAG